MTNATPSTLTTAKDSAIEVSATAIAPINQDTQNAVALFAARPAVAATLSALNATGNGLKLVWEHEKEYGTGQTFLLFLWDALKAIFAPLFAVLWLAINKGYVWSRKPQTRVLVAAKWTALKIWASPKYDYDRAAKDEAALKL